MSNRTIRDTSFGMTIRESLQADCPSCFGLCCTALNIVASSDFAMHKPAGKPCSNLTEDYSCQIHSKLRMSGYKGCTVFDCLGAGQHVSQVTFKGKIGANHENLLTKCFKCFQLWSSYMK